jgi:GTP-binding protein HflX
MADTFCNTAIVYPVLNEANGSGRGVSCRSSESGLQEACALALAVNLNIVHSEIVKIPTVRPSTYIGKGRLDDLAAIVGNTKTELVIFNCSLSPMQQRNLEKALNAKVIDRTALILEIFGERASTREGVLQVELAHLVYQKSRLVRSWTHLERQRGGAGFLGGPGEKQIEMDRRIIGDKIVRIKKELENVKRTRGLHRKSRQKVPFPVVALVGYTNAGKSTLFNRITGAGVYAENALFATLDPTMRQIRLPNGTKAILSDTVGFISDLPTELIAAFRATLEEVVEADIILHVRDVAHFDTEAQKQDVCTVLKGLGLTDKMESNMIEVYNKVDLLSEDECARYSAERQYDDKAAISALTGQGVDRLLSIVEDKLCRNRMQMTVKLSYDNGKIISWLYGNSEVIKKEDKDTYINFYVRIDKEKAIYLQSLMKEENKC